MNAMYKTALTKTISPCALYNGMKKSLKGENITSAIMQTAKQETTKLKGLAESSAAGNLNNHPFGNKNSFKEKFEKFKTIASLYSKQFLISAKLFRYIDVINLCKDNNGEIPVKETEAVLDFTSHILNDTYYKTSKSKRKNHIINIINNCKNSDNSINLEAISLLKKTGQLAEDWSKTLDQVTKLCQDENGISTEAISFYNDIVLIQKVSSAFLNITPLEFLSKLQTLDNTISKQGMQFVRNLNKKILHYNNIVSITHACRAGKKYGLQSHLINLAEELIANNVREYDIARVIELCTDYKGNILPQNKQTFYELRNNIKSHDNEIEIMPYLINSNTRQINPGMKSLIFDLLARGIYGNQVITILENFQPRILSKDSQMQEAIKNDFAKRFIDICKSNGLNEYGINNKIEEFFDLISTIKKCKNNETDINYKLELYRKIQDISAVSKVLFEQMGLDLNEYKTSIFFDKAEFIKTPKMKQNKFLSSIVANNNEQAENILKSFDFTKYKSGLPLKYSRDDFNSNIDKILKCLSLREKVWILNHFNLIEGKCGFDGFPKNELKEGNFPQKLQKIAQKVKQEIDKFTLDNEITTGNKEADDVFNSLIQGLPEFTSIIGKKQHGTHAYSIDIHTLKVLQSCINNPLYQELSDSSKTVLKISALIHDFGKKGGVVDRGHARKSALYAKDMLNKFNFPANIKEQIIDTVNNHHWFEGYNTGTLSEEDIAVLCIKPESFKIYQILAKADFENVNKDFHLGRSGCKNQSKFDKFMQEKMVPIQNVIDDYVHSQANFIFDTKFIKNGELFPIQTVKIDGKETKLKVLDLNKLSRNESLEPYGFAPGTTKANARFLVHMNDNIQEFNTINFLLNNVLEKSCWSCSLISPYNNTVYQNRTYGQLFHADQTKFANAFKENMCTGSRKSIKNFKHSIFYLNYEGRTYVRNALINELGKKGIRISVDKYKELAKYLYNKKYLTQIKENIKIGNQEIKAEVLRECLGKSRDKLLNFSQHNEIETLDLIPAGLVAIAKSIEDCSEAFLEYADKNKLPIVIMEEK